VTEVITYIISYTLRVIFSSASLTFATASGAPTVASKDRASLVVRVCCSDAEREEVHIEGGLVGVLKGNTEGE
jgi:hypothetical protein